MISEIVAHYRIPVFNKIAEQLGRDFHVLFLGELGIRTQWKVRYREIDFSYTVLPGLQFQIDQSFAYFLNPTILWTLCRFRPDIVIVESYQHPSVLFVILYAKLFKKRLVLWTESNRHDIRSGHPVKQAYKRWFVRNCTEHLAVGKASFEYLLSLRADADRIWVAPDAVDNDFFSKACDRERGEGKAFKQSKGYPEKLILYVGRLTDPKGIPDLLTAFQVLCERISHLGLVLVGSGEGESRYKDFCQVNNLRRVFFEGFVHQEDLPAYYAAADVFVLPTHSDPWGLVLNEAMACKLPVVATDVAGAARDLICHGENGYVYKKGDLWGLIRCIQKVLEGDKEKMGQRSYEIVQNYSPQKCAQGFLEVIDKTENAAYPQVAQLKDEIGQIHE